MAVVQVELGDDQEQIILLYRGIKRIHNKPDAINDLISTIGRDYVNQYVNLK